MPTALVTGASAGLGLEFARLLAADRHDLVLVARRKDRLDRLAAELSAAHGVTCHVVECDLAGPAGIGPVVAAVADLAARGVAIDLLVNNAGFGSNGPFVEQDAARESEMVRLNCEVVLALTRALLPAMVARRSGRVLNVGSIAGFQPGPFMTTYCATKAFVNSFTEALAVELAGTGVTATCSCPGPIATEFGAIAGNDKSRAFGFGAASARDVARQALAAAKRGRTTVIHGAFGNLASFGNRFMPRSWIRNVAAYMNRAGHIEPRLPPA